MTITSYSVLTINSQLLVLTFETDFTGRLALLSKVKTKQTVLLFPNLLL